MATPVHFSRRLPAIRHRSLFRCSLPPHHFVDPDRGEWGCASFGTRIVPVYSQLLTDRDGPLAMVGMVDADFRETGVHRPLHFGGGAAHLRLDPIEQSGQVESF